MKYLMLIALYCCCALPAPAQIVTCSAAVDHSTCETVTRTWSVLFPEPVMKNVTFELATPQEFENRKAALEKDDAGLGIRCGNCAPDYPGAPKPQEFVNSYNPDVVLFLRAKDSRGYFPTRLLISTDAFSAIENFKQEKNADGTVNLTSVLDHQFHKDQLDDLTTFIRGFYVGMEAALLDQGEAVKQLK